MTTTNVTSEIGQFLRNVEDNPTYDDILPEGTFVSAADQLDEGKPELALKCLEACLKGAEETINFDDEFFVSRATSEEELNEAFEDQAATETVEVEQDIKNLKRWIEFLT